MHVRAHTHTPCRSGYKPCQLKVTMLDTGIQRACGPVLTLPTQGPAAPGAGAGLGWAERGEASGRKWRILPALTHPAWPDPGSQQHPGPFLPPGRAGRVVGVTTERSRPWPASGQLPQQRLQGTLLTTRCRQHITRTHRLRAGVGAGGWGGRRGPVRCAGAVPARPGRGKKEDTAARLTAGGAAGLSYRRRRRPDQASRHQAA